MAIGDFWEETSKENLTHAKDMFIEYVTALEEMLDQAEEYAEFKNPEFLELFKKIQALQHEAEHHAKPVGMSVSLSNTRARADRLRKKYHKLF